MNISLVIPAYREGDSIARTLSSIGWSYQNLSSDVKVRVIVAINNPEGADSQILEQNKKTSDFLKNLHLITKQGEFINAKGNTPLPQILPAYDSKKIQEGLDILGNNCDVIEIDMWSDGNAPRISNVGIARHRGFIEAKSYDLDNQGFIVSLDADSMISKWYLDIALETLSKYRKVLYGPRISLGFKNDEQNLLKIQQNDYLMSLLESLQTDLITSRKGGSQQYNLPLSYKMSLISDNTHFEGSNIVIPSEIYGGEYVFPPIGGEEDTYLCNSLINGGLNPINNKGLIVLSQDRISDRTDTGDGAYNKSVMGDPNNVKVRSLEGTKILLRVFNIIIGFNRGKIHISEIDGAIPEKLKFTLQAFSKYLDKDGYFDINNIENELFNSELGRIVLEKHNTTLNEGFKELYSLVNREKGQPYFGIKKIIESISKDRKSGISLK